MIGYTKLFASIVHSTIWREDPRTKVLWVTMLALADQHGEVMASVPGLADVARISVEDCEAALDKFMSPDAYSRTPDNDGRRIESIPGGWSILNHRRYRDMQSEVNKRELAAERQRRRRLRLGEQDDTPPPPSRDLSRSVTPPSRESRHTEAEANTEAVKKKRTPRKREAAAIPDESLEDILKGGKGTIFWEAYWKLVGLFGPAKNPAPKTTARLYMSATVGYHPDHIQEKAEVLSKATSERKYLPQLAKWLEGGGYLNPNPTPHTGGQNGNRSPQHRAAVDAAYTESLGSRPVPTAPCIGDDPEMLGLFGTGPDAPPHPYGG